ncbi:MAG: shikimate kinase [Pseudonocardiales bacterium]|nr:shikimate kinase [Pseudonocardiales bacterium]
MTPRAVLVGLPGAGKSATGRRLAKVLVVPFADSDDLVHASTGRDVRAIFAADGEPEFRRVEADAVATALARFDGVLALGGGALDAAQTRERLAASGVEVIWLRTSQHLLVGRIGDGGTRPLLRGRVAEGLAELAAVREPLYRAAATMTVDCGERTPSQLAAHIAARLHAKEVGS